MKHVTWVATLLLLSGCGNDDGMADLRRFVASEQSNRVSTIQPMPQIKPYRSYAYQAEALREPFTPTPFNEPGATGSGDGIRPDPGRPREPLEAFPLDSLRMVGSLQRNQAIEALIRTQDGTIHRVRAGNHMGQNHGKIIVVSNERIELTEIVPDGSGGFLQRPAAVALSE